MKRNFLLSLAVVVYLGLVGCTSGANDFENAMMEQAVAEYNMAIKMGNKSAAAAQAEQIAQLYMIKKEYDTAESWKRTAQRHRGM